MGGPGKAALELLAHPLYRYPLDALLSVFGEAVVVAKRDNPVLPLPHGVELWVEPDEPRHPLVGICLALRRAAGRSICVCAADLPLIEPGELRALVLATELHRDSEWVAVVPRADGRLQPLCALYSPAALPALERAGPRAALTRVVAGLHPLVVERLDARPYLNVNTRAELEAAAAALRASRR
jgi:molybdopterin-guanine dinucleotide biosynthesis protein A